MEVLVNKKILTAKFLNILIFNVENFEKSDNEFQFLRKNQQLLHEKGRSSYFAIKTFN